MTTNLSTMFRLIAQLGRWDMYDVLGATATGDISIFDYSDGGLQVTVRGLNRADWGQVIRYSDGGEETVITLR